MPMGLCAQFGQPAPKNLEQEKENPTSPVKKMTEAKTVANSPRASEKKAEDKPQSVTELAKI